MEEEPGVYVFDEADKQNCFEISQVNHKYIEEMEEQISYQDNHQPHDKNIFAMKDESDSESQDDKDYEDQEEIQISSQQSDEDDEVIETNEQNPVNSLRKEYTAYKNIERIGEYHKSNATKQFYEISKVSVEGDNKEVMNITNIDQFILSPVHPNIMFECTMIKVSKGFLSHAWQVYSQNKFLMCAQKIIGSRIKYKVYSNKDMADIHYIGRIQSNFLGTQWFIFDNGVNPDKSRDLERVRKMLGSVTYQFNLFGKKGPRKMEIFLPSMTAETMKMFSCLENINILKHLYEKRPNVISRFINKQPEYDQKQDCYRLNFNGKIKTPSVKNFILIDEQTQKQTLFFGKTSEDLFFFQARYPFSPLQALALCISSADRKFGVE